MKKILYYATLPITLPLAMITGGLINISAFLYTLLDKFEKWCLK